MSYQYSQNVTKHFLENNPFVENHVDEVLNNLGREVMLKHNVSSNDYWFVTNYLFVGKVQVTTLGLRIWTLQIDYAAEGVDKDTGIDVKIRGARSVNIPID